MCFDMSLQSGGGMGFISEFGRGILRVVRTLQEKPRMIKGCKRKNYWSPYESFHVFSPCEDVSPGYSAERGAWSLVPGPGEHPVARRALQRLLLARRRSGSWSLPPTWRLAIEIRGVPWKSVDMCRVMLLWFKVWMVSETRLRNIRWHMGDFPGVLDYIGRL